MNALGFIWKVFGGMVAVILIAALVIYVSVLPALDERVTSETEVYVVQSASLVAELASATWQAGIEWADQQPLHRAAAALEGSRVTLITADGKVGYDSHEDPQVMDNHLGRPELQDPGVPIRRFSRTLQKEMTYCAEPVIVNGETRAYARVAIATVDLRARIAGWRAAIRNGVLLASLASLLFAAFFSQRLTRPLSNIASLVDEVGRGRTSRRLKVEGHDEVGRLARAVNKMADDIASHIERIEQDGAEREAILSTMTDGVLAMDHERRVLFINDPGCVFLQATEAEVLGKPIWELIRLSVLNELLDRCANEGLAVRGHADFETPEGQRNVEMSAAPMVELEGSSSGCVLILRDVSELRHLEAVRRDFVTNVSHELKTPLTAMRGYVEAVLEDDSMEPERRISFLTKAQRNTERLSAIVTDLLSLSRLESEEREMVFESRDVGELFGEAQAEVLDFAESHCIRIELQSPTPPIQVEVDTPMLVLALSNLISNAVRYSPNGAVVWLSARCAANEVRLEVKDHGPGIPPQDLDRIFERFYRVDKARSRNLGGTGLGLSIVNHAIHAHEGRVEVASEVGKGSTFTLVLKAHTSQPRR
ncbi:MAG: two-component system phosphate regulon sensor histidine kinase PhoR [Candidatus Paceibacteria bacterium]|jgi:two-component system phosphate regulon sensor histidine kinase PhoR